jgi:hypothetical protein
MTSSVAVSPVHPFFTTSRGVKVFASLPALILPARMLAEVSARAVIVW